MTELICPVCGEVLTLTDRTYKCKSNHCFDTAKEGYVNLLTGSHKPGSETGDNKDMAQCRREFLSEGYFDALVRGIIEFIKEKALPRPVIADICCGEGYYGDRIKNEIDCEMLGFDLSKEMVRLAAKRKNGITYFVGNLSRIPLKDKSVDIALHLFAPFHEKEFSRIIKDDGCILNVVAGENHLFELKELLYDTPYKNDEKPPETAKLTLSQRRKITARVHLKSNRDIMALFKMTPYYYHTRDEDKAKLRNIDSLDITTEFVVFIYTK
ncbi:MAG: methyltransferase domain-containing protein [Clostridia bacterium]|nr:methyltransferase domain-containing protein [Clostridia bacterium]